MCHKKIAGTIKRILAGILVVELVLTGTPAVNVEAANEVPGQTEPAPENPEETPKEEDPGDEEAKPGEKTPGEEETTPGDKKTDVEKNPGEEDSGAEENPGDDNPGEEEEKPEEIPPGGEENDSKEEDPGDGESKSEEESKPEEENPEDEEGSSEEEEADKGEEENTGAVFGTSVSENDLDSVSENALEVYEPEVTGIRVVGGNIDLPGDWDVPVVDERARVSDYEEEVALLMADSVPATYEPEPGSLPLTRSQSPYGSCWAHSAMALAEIDMMKHSGVSRDDADYSELHLAYFSYNGAVNDPLGGLEGDANFRTDGSFMGGGNISLARNVLTNWVGAADENTAPYPHTKLSDEELKALVPESSAFSDAAHLQNVYQVNLKENADDAKRMIMEYGGIGVSYYADEDEHPDYYNSKNNCYYQNDVKEKTNHAVTAVGWNDKFSKDNFTIKPEGDGAWLIRNSWSEGEDTDSRSIYTYFWLSYYDASLSEAGYAFDFEDADNYHHNYQYDGGMQTNSYPFPYNSDSRVRIANVFTAKAYEGGERLEAVGIAFEEAQVPYKISIYTNLQNENDPESGTLAMDAVTSGTSAWAGFYTVSLNNPVNLVSGEPFSVVVELKPPRGSDAKRVGAAYEYPMDAWYKCEVTAKPGQSFYNTGSGWADFGKENNANLRIKAYTVDDAGESGLPVSIELPEELQSENGIEVGLGDTYRTSYTVLPRSAKDRSVAWESSDPSVVTVDENGLLTGRKAGEATITITSVAAPSVKASFHVTVFATLRDIKITGGSRVTAGETLSLQTVRIPSGISADDVQWQSSDERVLTMSADGVVTGVAPGYATVTAGIGEVTATKEITCEYPAFVWRYSVSGEGLQLSWDGYEWATDYQVYRAEEGETQFSCLASIPSEEGKETYSYLDRSVEGGKKYRYEVKALVPYIRGNDTETKTVSTGVYIMSTPMPFFYPITYHLNGGSNSAYNPNYYREETTRTLYRATRAGYDFTGWYADVGLTQKCEKITSDMSGALDLYAGWEPITYSITYYRLDGAANHEENPFSFTIESESFTLKEPTKLGYRFLGWYTDSAYTTPISEIKKGVVYVTSGTSLYLYAKWEEVEKKITYELDGGVNAAENPSTYISTDGTVSLKNPTKMGYDFQGWYKENTYENRVYNLYSSLVKDDLTLYAKWGIHTYKITYNNGGTHSNPTSYTIEDLDFTLQDAVKSGYRFAGWYTDYACTKPISEIKTDVCANIVVYAKWEQIYTITYELNGGVNDPSNPAIYVKADVITLGNPTKEGYTFAGWYTDGAFANQISEIKDRSGNLTLYAKWREDDALENGVLILQPESFTYTGTEQEPQVTVRVGSDVLVEDQDYIVSYHNNRDAGTATVVAEGIGSYYGSLSQSFEIEPAVIRIRAKDLTILVGSRIPNAEDYEYEINGLLMDDTLLKEPTFICDISNTQTAGQFLIVPSAADAGPNYTIDYEAGQLLVVSENLVYRVIFDVEGHGTAPTALYDIKAGSTIDEPAAPEAEGYVFKGWCKDAACTIDWDFETDIVQSDITLYARWLKKSAQAGSAFQMQEMEDIYYYTGNACKPAVRVYDGETLLKAGKDYTVKYFNNINANAGGVWKKGNGQGADFNQTLPYVQIIGKGNYTDEIKVNFDIHPAVIADEKGNPAQKVVLRFTDQFVTAKKGVLKPFGSVKYIKGMKKDRDYRLTLTAVNVIDSDGNVVANNTVFDMAQIPAGYAGEFLLKVEGIGNYEGSILKTIQVTDKAHLMKNARITLGKNQKSVELVEECIELAPSTENSADTFTVKIGNTILTPDEDYAVSYLDDSNQKVGKATLVITGLGEYVGTKTANFTVRGKAFTAKNITVTGIENKVYTGRAITQNDAVLVYNAGQSDESQLTYGRDYTVSYAKNINKGTAAITFKGLAEAGFSGSFKKSFKIKADNMNAVNRAEGWDTISVEYSKAGAKPTEQLVFTNAGGVRLKNGKDYTLSYRNNNLVANSRAEKAPTIIVKGKGNYEGSFEIPFTITKADLRSKWEKEEVTIRTTAVAYQPKRADDYAYKPAVKVLEGKTALRVGKDVEITYRNNTQADYNAYIQSLDAGNAAAPVPMAIITVNEESSYALGTDTKGQTVSSEIAVPLTIYRNKLTKKNIYVAFLSESIYTGAQVRPEVQVFYLDAEGKRIGLDKEYYTLSYGANNRAGKNAGSVTISGIGSYYGGDVTVKFTIQKKKLLY